MTAQPQAVEMTKEQRRKLIADYFQVGYECGDLNDEKDIFGMDFTEYTDDALRKLHAARYGEDAPKKVTPPPPAAVAKPIRIDIGCGKNKRKDGEWIGVDSIAFDGVDVVVNLCEKHMVDKPIKDSYLAMRGPEFKPWPWDTDSVDEANCSHFLEHLTNLNDKWERVHFFNELYRVLKPGAKCTLTLPHWCSNRYYGDPTHKEPFSEMGFYYLSREWRKGDATKGIMANAPHADKEFNPHGYDCNFVATWGYGLNPAIQSRNTEYQTFALQNYKDAATDMIATLVKA